MKLAPETPYCAIYQLLDELRLAQSIPVGALGRVFEAVDTLRTTGAPAFDIAIAERLSVALLRWGHSGRTREEAFRTELAELTADWLEVRLPHPVRVRVPTNAQAPMAAQVR